MPATGGKLSLSQEHEVETDMANEGQMGLLRGKAGEGLEMALPSCPNVGIYVTAPPSEMMTWSIGRFFFPLEINVRKLRKWFANRKVEPQETDKARRGVVFLRVRGALSEQFQLTCK